MQNLRCYLGIMAVATVSVLAQNAPNTDKVTVKVGGPSQPPLAIASCKESSYGNLHHSHRTKLTPEEIGEYISRVIQGGNIVTVYPETKDGIFVYARCPNVEPKDVR